MIPYSDLPRDKRDLLAGHPNMLLITILNLDNRTISADEDSRSRDEGTAGVEDGGHIVI